MSVLTKLSALRMQEAELLRTPCAWCAHPLSLHRLMPEADGRRKNPPCHHMRAGDFVCKCPGWCETRDEQLSIV